MSDGESIKTTSSSFVSRRISTSLKGSSFKKKSFPLPLLRDNLNLAAAVHGEILGFSVSITLPYSRTGPKPNGMRVLFVLCITMAPPLNAPPETPLKTWEAVKKFSDFVAFDRECKRALLGDLFSADQEVAGLAVLPVRTLLTSQFDERIIFERRVQFLDYIRSVVQLSKTCEALQLVLATFLGFSLGQNRRGSKTTKPDQQEPELAVAGTALRLGENQHGFVYKLSGQHTGRIKPTFRLVWMLLNMEEGEVKFYNPEQTLLLGEMKLGNEFGKVTLAEPKEFGIPGSNAFGFSIWTPKREAICYAETSEDRQMWVDAISRLLSPKFPSEVIVVPNGGFEQASNPILKPLTRAVIAASRARSESNANAKKLDGIHEESSTHHQQQE